MSASNVLGRAVHVTSWRQAVPRLLLVAVLIGAGVFWYRAERTGIHFHGLFTASVGIYPGSDVRVLGVPVGEVDSVTPRGTVVDIGMHLDPDISVSASSIAVIISPNLVSDRYIQLTGATTKTGPRLADGAVIPLARTRANLELDELYRSLSDLTKALGPSGANARGALSRLITVGAANLKGNGAAFNKTLRDLSRVTAALGDGSTNVATTLAKLSSFTAMLAKNDASLRQVNTQLASVTQTLAADRQTFAAALHELAIALGEVKAFVAENRAQLRSNIANLSRVATTLANRRASLAEALQAAPVLVQNFLNAYDPQHNVLRGRADLNELTTWASGTTVSGDATAGPPTLLPAANVDTAGGAR